eukprot:GDKJ01017204.1.p1 GENE.GDKJ01017204.1~~GDKJ01017204.1.p1  ORF type:complete len:178 (-),score=53.13 GDKJ01017204.1:118-627(-)
MYNTPSSVFQRAAYEDEDEEDEESDEEEEVEEEDEDNEGGLLNTPAPKIVSKGLHLSDEADIESPAFQKKWAKLEAVEVIPLRFKSIPSADALEERLETVNIFAMAQGQQGGTTKVYLFAQPTADMNAHYLVELLIQATAAGQATIKTDDKHGKEFAALFKKAISAFCS